MSRLVRATELVGLPVVTLKGDDVAEVRDVVYEPAGGLIGFTLNRRGYLSGRLKQVLTVDGVTSIGRHAVMTGTEGALTEKADVPSAVAEAADRDVIGASVVTDDGTALGEVIDVILSVDDHAEAVGYELLSNGAEARHAFVPLPEQLAVSGDAVIVPAGLDDFVRHDLTGFGSAIERYRNEHGFRAAAGDTTKSASADPRPVVEAQGETRVRPDGDVMTTFGAARGMPVLTRSTAEQVGEVKHFVVEGGRVRSLQVEGGRHGQLIAWDDVSFGDDAVIIEDTGVLRDAKDDREGRALRGELELLGKRVLSDSGDELGEVSEVSFDPDDGTIISVAVPGATIAGDRFIGVGSYAVVVAASAREPQR